MKGEILISKKHDGKEVVSAKELYLKLGLVKSQWVRWYKQNIINNPFAIKGEDWEELDMMSRSKDFVVSMDFAKRLSMLARTEKGEHVREYFVACEKKALEISSKSIEEVIVKQQKEISTLKAMVGRIENQNPVLSDMFSIKGYASLKGQFIDTDTASKFGKKASRICKREGLRKGKIPDPRFGLVGLYPRDVLERVFKGYVAF